MINQKGGDSDSHGHPPDPKEVEKERILFQIKEDAVAYPGIFPERCLRRLQSVRSAILARLPDREKLKKRIQRGGL